MKSTAVACANQGLIKYWGCKDRKLRLPWNDSISVCLDKLTTTTTVESSRKYDRDMVIIDGSEPIGKSYDRVIEQLDRIRRIAKSHERAKVISKNSFPPASGLASSASGFAALTLAGTDAFGLSLKDKELSILARLASGSASRSIPGGFSEWFAGARSEDSYAVCLATSEDIDMKTLVVIVGLTQKKISSTEAMDVTVKTSPFFSSRLAYLRDALPKMKEAIKNRSINDIARLAEIDSLNMASCCFTSDPPIIYWLPSTLAVMNSVVEMRENGADCHYSMDAGGNVFINTTSEYIKEVNKTIKRMLGVIETMECKVGGKAKLLPEGSALF